MTETLDLVLRGGTIVDGTGAPGVPGDVGILGGRIVELGEVRGGARQTIDARDRVVAPGFVDIHTHYDAQILWDRMLTISPWHGVTTVVVGNCGFGIAPTRPEHRELILQTLENVEGMSLAALEAGCGLDWPFETFPEYLDTVEKRGSAINMAALVGHTPVRTYVMGEEATEREARPEEIEQMCAIVTEALKAGAIGFASSRSPTHAGYRGKPVPSREASMDELSQLARCLGEVDHGVMQATIGPGFFTKELAELQREIGKPVSWTALLAGMLGPDGHRSVLEETARQQSEGVEVYPQVSCRPLMFEFKFKSPFIFESLPLFKEVSAADLEGKKRIYASPEFRARFKEARGFGSRWDTVVIASLPQAPELEEARLTELAAQRGVHPIDLALDLSLECDLEARFRMAVVNTDEEIVAELLNHPTTILGLSDAGAHADQLCDSCFSTHLLGHWVRDRGALGLEQAVRLLTSRSAEVFGLRDRGRLAVGLPADVVVFDPETVGCMPLRRVNDLPAGAERLVADAQGIDAVIVNGQILRENGEERMDPDGPLPGRLLRGGVSQ